jgi:hypothetical protein
MYAKAAVLIGAAVASYVFLVFWATNGWSALAAGGRWRWRWSASASTCSTTATTARSRDARG